MTQSKRKEYIESLEEKKYQVAEAMQFLQSAPKVKFNESIDVAINLGIDPSKSDQNMRGATILPAGSGKPCKVAVFVEGDEANSAKEAGADAVGMDDLAEELKKADVATAVKNAKAGQIRYRSDKAAIIHGRIGDITYSAEQIKQNLETLLDDLKRNKPPSAKGVFIKKATLSSTMGAGVEIDLSSLNF